MCSNLSFRYRVAPQLDHPGHCHYYHVYLKERAEHPHEKPAIGFSVGVAREFTHRDVSQDLEIREEALDQSVQTVRLKSTE